MKASLRKLLGFGSAPAPKTANCLILIEAAEVGEMVATIRELRQQLDAACLPAGRPDHVYVTISGFVNGKPVVSRYSLNMSTTRPEVAGGLLAHRVRDIYEEIFRKPKT